MSQLTQYIIALTNLYGLVHKNKVEEIYNSQNEEQITLSDVEALLNNPTQGMEKAFVHTHEEYFVHETIMEFDEFDLMLGKKGDKPYYIPEKDILLKYVKDGYFEKTKEYNELLEYVKKNFIKGEKAEWLCEDIHGYCEFGDDMQSILDKFTYRGIQFTGIEQANEVIQLITALYNNVRIWDNNGYTPQEIFEKFEKPNLRPLPDKPFDFAGIAIKKEKIGRNDPCHCGSGKKYKKCCFGKNGY